MNVGLQRYLLERDALARARDPDQIDWAHLDPHLHLEENRERLMEMYGRMYRPPARYLRDLFERAREEDVRDALDAAFDRALTERADAALALQETPALHGLGLLPTPPARGPVMPPTAAQFADSTPSPTWVIRGALPVGLTLLLGDPKNGKTLVELSMAYAVATGKPWLDRFPVERAGPVLLIEQDSAPGTLAAEVRAFSAGAGGAPPNLFIESQKNYAIDEEPEALAALVGKVQPSLVTLDTFDRLVSPGFSESATANVNRVVGRLQKLALTQQCAILLVHHLSKAAGADRVRGARGSSVMEARADVVYHGSARHVDDGVTDVTLATARTKLLPLDPLVIRFTTKIGEDGLPERTVPSIAPHEDAPAKEAPPGRRRNGLQDEALLNFVRAHPGADIEQIAAGVGRSVPALRPRLKVLRAQGRLAHKARGPNKFHYTIPGVTSARAIQQPAEDSF